MCDRRPTLLLTWPSRCSGPRSRTRSRSADRRSLGGYAQADGRTRTGHSPGTRDVPGRSGTSKLGCPVHASCDNLEACGEGNFSSLAPCLQWLAGEVEVVTSSQMRLA